MANYSLLKHKLGRFKSKKAMYVTWDELEGSESAEDFDNEEAMLCFHGFEENDDRVGKTS